MLGVIHAGTLVRRDFTEEDAELLQAAAERAGLGIERALVHEELVRLDRLQRDFIGFASHELRTPATVIYGVLETLRSRREELSDEQAAELEETLYTQSVRMKDLLERLLDFSMLDAGGFTRGERSQRAGGVGLGLAIAHSHARAHGGDLRHEPVPQGARFEFVLPVHDVA